MSEWTVVTVIVTLVGLCTAVIRPLICLNNTITRLTQVVRELEKNISELSSRNSETHGRMWTKMGMQDETINAHETRLSLVERVRA